MKRLNPNEKRLLHFFLAACAVCVSLLGVKLLVGTYQSMQDRLTDLREQHAANQQWIAEKPLWDARAAWMENHPAPKANPQVAASNLLSHLQSALTDKGVKIAEQAFSPAGPEGEYETVKVRLKLNGPFSTVAKWLYEVQQTESYFGIRKISLRSETEPSQVVCDVEVTQFIQNE